MAQKKLTGMEETMQEAFPEHASLIRENRDALLSYWRMKIRRVPVADALDRATLNDHMPSFLEELSDAFTPETDDMVITCIRNGASAIHGVQRLGNGFPVEEVVAEYNVLRDCIHELADKHGVRFQGQSLQRLNQALDTAIGAAIKAYIAQQALDTQRRRDEYLAFIAHDLRTPLNAIAVSTQLLEKEVASANTSERALKLVQTLQRNVGYLTAQVSKVLEENIQLGTEFGVRVEQRRLDLWPLVEALIQDLRPIAKTTGTRLINAVPDDLPVFADAGLLRRVFQNLITNAIRHTAQGEVKISAKYIDLRKSVQCTIADNGSGITEDRIPYIFNKFETDGKSATDLGLGLSICKTFIEAHGGIITVESRAGIGTHFYFTLPDDPANSAAWLQSLI